MKCPYCKEELADWIKKEELPKVAEICKLWQELMSSDVEGSKYVCKSEDCLNEVPWSGTQGVQDE